MVKVIKRKGRKGCDPVELLRECYIKEGVAMSSYPSGQLVRHVL